MVLAAPRTGSSAARTLLAIRADRNCFWARGYTCTQNLYGNSPRAQNKLLGARITIAGENAYDNDATAGFGEFATASECGGWIQVEFGTSANIGRMGFQQRWAEIDWVRRND
jgi:hypothetical protein